MAKLILKYKSHCETLIFDQYNKHYKTQDAIIDVTEWKQGSDPYVEGARDKKQLLCPDNHSEESLIPKHKYLFKL